jgi:hypothetical protein
VIFDPADTEELTIEYQGFVPWTARELVIGERSGPRPKMPEHMLPQPADTSRLLEAATQRNIQRKIEQQPAVSYRKVNRVGGEAGRDV